MAKSPVNLKSLDVNALLALRSDVDKRLSEKRRELETELSRLGYGKSGANGSGAKRRGTVKGSKVAPKFRGPEGETWAGRGAQPRWLTALLKEGRKLEEFAIDSATASRRKSSAKKSGRKAS